MKTLLMTLGVLALGLTSNAATTKASKAASSGKVPVCKDQVTVTSNGPFKYKDERGLHEASMSGPYKCGPKENAAGVVSVGAPLVKYPTPTGYYKINGGLIINFSPGNTATLSDFVDTWMCKGVAVECELTNTMQIAAMKCNKDYTSCTTTDLTPAITLDVKWK